MLSIILADAEMELMPDSLAGHPQVRSHAKDRGKSPQNTLLDESHHHQAMRGLEPQGRRGRPDIVQLFMLLCLDSVSAQKGKLRCYVHTRNNDVIYIDPETRIPRNSRRFSGLMESLFLNGVIPDATNPLLKLSRGKLLSELVSEIKPDQTIVLDPGGLSVELSDIFSRNLKGNVAVIIGGFPEGTFTSDMSAFDYTKVSIYDGLLKVWTVTSEVLSAHRRTL